MKKENGSWKLIRVKDVFTHLGLNDVYLVSYNLGF